MMKNRIKYLILGSFCLLFLFSNLSCSNYKDRKVVFLSIDGLHSDAITVLGPEGASTLHYLMKNGVYTLNARTDNNSTSTLPNHVGMLTALPMKGKRGHNITDNYFGAKTIHDFNGKYIYSIFDTLKSHNRKTAIIASKPKFGIFSFSYIVKDSFLARKYGYNDKAKIDYSHINNSNDLLARDTFLKISREHEPHFIFLHLKGCDSAGHRYKWDLRPNSKYLKAVKRIDKLLGRIVQQILREHDAGRSIVLIVTSDHGGYGKKHSDISNKNNFTVPFIVWGSGVAKGKDLYAINKRSRKDPGTERISFKAKQQPIRNSDGANLALSILGLEAIKNSVINVKLDLNIYP